MCERRRVRHWWLHRSVRESKRLRRITAGLLRQERPIAIRGKSRNRIRSADIDILAETLAATGTEDASLQRSQTTDRSSSIALGQTAVSRADCLRQPDTRWHSAAC